MSLLESIVTPATHQFVAVHICVLGASYSFLARSSVPVKPRLGNPLEFQNEIQNSKNSEIFCKFFPAHLLRSIGGGAAPRQTRVPPSRTFKKKKFFAGQSSPLRLGALIVPDRNADRYKAPTRKAKGRECLTSVGRATRVTRYEQLATNRKSNWRQPAIKEVVQLAFKAFTAGPAGFDTHES